MSQSYPFAAAAKQIAQSTQSRRLDHVTPLALQTAHPWGNPEFWMAQAPSSSPSLSNALVPSHCRPGGSGGRGRCRRLWLAVIGDLVGVGELEGACGCPSVGNVVGADVVVGACGSPSVGDVVGAGVVVGT